MLIRLIAHRLRQLHVVRSLEANAKTLRIVRGRITAGESRLDVEVCGSRKTIRELEDRLERSGIQVSHAS